MKAAHPRISIIVAYAANRVIGKDGKMPWHLSEDLKRFRQLTMGHHIVMGRKTWESISRLLPGRKHIIISRNPGYKVPGAKVVDSLDAAIAAARGNSEIFVIGGSEIYKLALQIADRILVTEIQREYEGDTYLPELAKGIWRETARENRVDAASGLRYCFVTLERRV
ncbi:MAG TPA: dihydrofolate reductase [Burkholderiales bacterium]|nr:dihydrofolate reductase [Burkholderiales bacterium]